MRFSTQTVYRSDDQRRTIRSFGIVDLATGYAWSRLTYDSGGSVRPTGLVVWASPDGASVQQLRSDGSPDGPIADTEGGAMHLLGWPSMSSAEGGSSGVGAAIEELLGRQSFGVGTPATLDGTSVVHYQGTPRKGEDPLPIELWVSADDVIVRLAVDLEQEGDSAHLVSDLSDVGTDAEIPVPPDLGPEQPE